MSRSSKILIAVFALLLIGSAAALLFAPKNATVAKIYLNGKLFKTVDLSKVTESYTISVGEGNTVLVQPGKISMQSADCPDKLCVKQGATSSPLHPIVCLPNKVMIIVETAGKENMDVITGGAAS